jgi:hypothetical protein
VLTPTTSRRTRTQHRNAPLSAKVISYLKLSIGDDTACGVGEDTDTAKANFDAVLSAVTRIPGSLDRLAGRVSSGDGQKASSPLKP